MCNSSPGGHRMEGLIFVNANKPIIKEGDFQKNTDDGYGVKYGKFQTFKSAQFTPKRDNTVL